MYITFCTFPNVLVPKVIIIIVIIIKVWKMVVSLRNT